MSERFPQFSPPFFDFKYPNPIPSNWNWISLSTLVEPKQWQTLSQSSFLERGFPVYGANGQIGFYSEYNHEKPVIAVSCRGACGDVHLTKPFSYVSSNAMCLDNISDEVDQKFLYFGLIYRTLQDTISGSAQPQITGQSLQKVKFPAPPLSEQKKIASILTSVDEVIENTQKQIDKLQDIKKATMNELLTKGIGHTEFKNSELGQIPKSWEIVKLDDITTKVVDGPHSTPEYLSSGIPFVTVKNIISGEIEFTNLKYISEADFEQFMHRGKPDVGDILYSKDGSIGYTAIVKSKNRFAYFVSVALIKIKHELVFSNFLNNALQSEYVWMQTKLMTEGSGLKHMVLKNIKALKIAMPSMLEQQKISHIIHSIDELIGRRKSKFLQIQSLKKSLMQDLLTGKVRVTVN